MNGFKLELVSLEGREVPSAVAVAPPTAAAVVRATTPTPQQELRAFLDSVRQQADLPAIAAGTIANGQTTIAATGVRERGKAVAVTDADQFHLGSNGKAMTSTLAAILVDRGFLRWNTTIGELYPELRGKLDPTLAKATFEQLLNHRSGFLDENVDERVLVRAQEYRGAATLGRRLLLPEILKTPMGTPGDFNYSNVGYTIAGSMMERVTGNAYEWLMQKYIFRPLSMGSAGFGPPGTRLLDQPRGHNDAGKSVGNGPSAELPRLMSPAGLMHMNMADWSKFLRVHLGERVNGVKLLSEASLTKLHTAVYRSTEPLGTNYGFGWIHAETPLGTALFHNGSNGYWYSAAVLIPKMKVAAFAVTNQVVDTAIDDVVQTLVARNRR